MRKIMRKQIDTPKKVTAGNGKYFQISKILFSLNIDLDRKWHKIPKILQNQIAYSYSDHRYYEINLLEKYAKIIQIPSNMTRVVKKIIKIVIFWNIKQMVQEYQNKQKRCIFGSFRVRSQEKLGVKKLKGYEVTMVTALYTLL